MIDRESMINWFNRIAPNHKCPVCNNNDGWDLTDQSSSPVALTGGNYDYNNTFPMVMASCKNCGYVLHFRLNRTGLIDT